MLSKRTAFLMLVLLAAQGQPTLSDSQTGLQTEPSPLNLHQPLAGGSPNWVIHADPKTAARVPETYGKLPLSFEANNGQTDPNVKFLSRGSGYTLFLTGDEAVFALRGGKAKDDPSGFASRLRPRAAFTKTTAETKIAVLKMTLLNANRAAKVTGADELPGKSNYFIGNDPKKWRSNVPTYTKVKYDGIYSGIDLVYYGNQRQLEYDFIVAPGVDPHRVQFDVQGAKSISRDRSGDLVLQMAEGEVRWHKPVVYQEEGGIKREVDGRYVIKRPKRVSFEVAAYDLRRPLTIDPVLSYSTYLGGSAQDSGSGIAVDSSGNAYVTGLTSSTDFPTASPFQPSLGGTINAFVTKINATGSALVYSTYLGGSGIDTGNGIAVDSSGSVFVTGYTTSTDFPTVNPLQPSLGGSSDSFVTKINATGSVLVYSTYLGGSGADGGNGIAVDSSGNAYVTGFTESSNFPTLNPLQPIYGGSEDAFVAQLNSSGSALVYSTYLGGNALDQGFGIAVDSSGNAYVTGQTFSTNFPTMNPFQPTCGSGTCGPPNFNQNAFVTKINSSGSALAYSTYLGGSNNSNGGDYGVAIAVDSMGDAYVTGYATSFDFPLMNPFEYVLFNSADAFVTKFNANGTALVYSTFLGTYGSCNYLCLSEGNGIAVDSSGNAYITGITGVPDFPIQNAVQPKIGGQFDGFVTVFDASGSALVYSTYLGGNALDQGFGIAVDSSGNAYVTGQTLSTNFPTMNPLQPKCNGCGDAPNYYSDAFVSKLTRVPLVTISPSGLNFGDQDLGTVSSPQNITLINSGDGALNISSIVTSGDFSQTNTCPVGGSLAAGSNCFITVAFTPSVQGIRNGVLAIADNAANSPQSIGLTGTGIIETTTTNLTSSLNPVAVGQSVALSAAVYATFQVPTGTVTFVQNGKYTLGTAVLSNGQATLNYAFAVSETRSVTAVYSGAAGFRTSTSPPLSEMVVNGIPTTTTVSSNPNPSVVGQSVTLAATVSGSGGTPSGTVTFVQNGKYTLGMASLSGGQATLNYVFSVAEARTITASYSGDSTFAASISAPVGEVVNQATTTTILTSSPNPSTVGQSVTLTATVSPQFGGTPTGTIQFLQNSTYTLGTVTLSGGKAILSHAFPVAGTKSIVAIYSGDGNFTASISTALTQTVQ